MNINFIDNKTMINNTLYMNNQDIIAELIRRWNANHPGEKFRNKDFAVSIGMDETYFSRIKNGDVAKPGNDKLEAIARGFGVSLNDFLDMQKSPTAAPPNNVSYLDNRQQFSRSSVIGEITQMLSRLDDSRLQMLHMCVKGQLSAAESEKTPQKNIS